MADGKPRVKYQVFVSSTFRDLIDERREVIQAILELDAIPSGMELFPASDKQAWELIRGVIDDCDYYVIIVGNRYGSLGPDGISFTEMEYRYAVETDIPVLPFLHAAPDTLPYNKSETNPEARDQMGAFRETLEAKHHVKYFSDAKDLGSKISRALVNAFRQHERPGWVRGGTSGDPLLITKLRQQIEEMQAEADKSRREPPRGVAHLAQGDHAFRFAMLPHGTDWGNARYIDATWDEIFGWVGPNLMGECPEAALESAIEKEARGQIGGPRSYMYHIAPLDFGAIKVQLNALGLMVTSDKKRSVTDTRTYWQLTPYGETYLTKLRAIPIGQTEVIPDDVEEGEDGEDDAEGGDDDILG